MALHMHSQLAGVRAIATLHPTKLPRVISRQSRCTKPLLRVRKRRSGTNVRAEEGSSMRRSYKEVESEYGTKLEAFKQKAQECMTTTMAEVRQRSSNEDGPATSTREPDLQLRQRIRGTIKKMEEGLIERGTEVRLLLLAALTQEHMLYIGPPGTAKSEVGRRLSSVVQGNYFERLLTRFSVPEELFGPLSMRALEEDKYIRQTRGYLPEAEVAFVDEIFKANSAILNTLLTILNERLFDNGSSRSQVPLITLVGASNELPESEELDALYDRFLVRRGVRQVSPAGLTEMLQYHSTIDQRSSESASSNGTGSSTTSSQMAVTREDLRRTRQAAIQSVKVPPGVIQLLADLRTLLQERMEPPVYVSDRRLVKAIALMQVAAYCNAQTTVSEYDCLLMQHVLWQRPEQCERIGDWILSQLGVDDGVKQVSFLMRGLFARVCNSIGGQKVDAEKLMQEISDLKIVLTNKLVQVAQSQDGDFPLIRGNLWLSEEEAEAVAFALGPKLKKSKEAVESVLFEVLTLEVAVQGNIDPVTLANLMPNHWADFIRNSPIDDVRAIGTTPIKDMRI